MHPGLSYSNIVKAEGRDSHLHEQHDPLARTPLQQQPLHL